MCKYAMYRGRYWRRCCPVLHHMRPLVRWAIQLRRERHCSSQKPRWGEGWRCGHRCRGRAVAHRVSPVHGGQHHHGEPHRGRPARRRRCLRSGHRAHACAIGLCPNAQLLRKQGASEAFYHKGLYLRFPGVGHLGSCTHTSKRTATFQKHGKPSTVHKG